MKRCFFVLILSMLGTPTIPVSGAAAATSTGRRNEDSNIPVPSMAMLARCLNTCGNLSFGYPFGIGPGCFRDPDFNLTCVDGGPGGTPRLFFGDGVTEVLPLDASNPKGINVGWTQDIRIAYAHTVPVVTSVDVYNMSWSPPGRSFMLLEASINVTGCGFDVYMLDHNTGTSSNVCSTTCPGGEITETTATQNCNGTWCCSVRFLLNFHGFQFSFVRRRDDSRVVDYTSPLWNKISVTTDYAELQWSVVDQPTCAVAEGEEATYACSSNHSSCMEAVLTSGGYHCSCNGGYLGNPYVPGGCSRDRARQ